MTVQRDVEFLEKNDSTEWIYVIGSHSINVI